MKLDINYYRSISKKPGKVLIFVAGDGDDKNAFLKAINHLAEKLPDYNFSSFTYTYVVAKNKKQLHFSTKDLEIVVDYLTNKLKVKEINLFCTSKGAYGTSYLIVNPKYKKLIKK